MRSMGFSDKILQRQHIISHFGGGKTTIYKFFVICVKLMVLKWLQETRLPDVTAKANKENDVEIFLHS